MNSKYPYDHLINVGDEISWGIYDVKIMVVCKGYCMVRRKRKAPFIIPSDIWIRNKELQENDNG